MALTAGKRSVGIYPETKHPTWHDSLDILKGTSISDLLLKALKKRGYGGDVLSEKWAAQPVFIQSFEVREQFGHAPPATWLQILERCRYSHVMDSASVYCM